MTIGMGMPVMAEPGSSRGSSTAETIAGLLLIAGLATLWAAVISGAATGFRRASRTGLAAIIVSGLASGLLMTLNDFTGDTSFVFAIFVPAPVVGAGQAVRLVCPQEVR